MRQLLSDVDLRPFGDSDDLKSHRRIFTVFFGNTLHAVKAQIWVAVCTYLLVLIAIKHHRLPVSPQIFLHLVETHIFETTTLDQLIANAVLRDFDPPADN